MINKITSEIDQLGKLDLIDNRTLDEFRKRLKFGKPYTKPQDPYSHFCVIFIPFFAKKKKVYIGDHIKANMWMSPGGHIDEGETPLETIKREFSEELDFKLTDEKIQLFAANVTECVPTGICKIHYDFFYIVFMNKLEDFKYEKREFRTAGWFNLDQAVTKVEFPDFNAIMKRLKDII